MVHRKVQVRRRIEQDADRLWRRICDFDLNWHPGVASCQVTRSAEGSVLRRFQDLDGQTYEEQRTYISHSDRVLCYTALSGIEGVLSYDARVAVSPLEDGAALLFWQADLSATEARADAIAAGTEAIFETALDTLAGFKGRGKARRKRDKFSPEQIRSGAMGDLPRLTYLAGSIDPDADHTLVVFLHGIGGQASNWRHQITALGQNFRMVALNLRGYGGSTLGFAPSQVDDYCEDILHLMQHFSASKLVLVGLSYGSWIATSFAVRHPERLAGLVLAGGCTGMSEAGAQERENFRISREVPLNAGQTPADFAPAVVDVIAGPNASAEVRQALHDSMAAIPVETYRDALNCFCNPLETFDFARLSMPVLMMTGAHDRLAPPDEIRRVIERIFEAGTNSRHQPDVQFEVIPDAGHLCNLEAPDAFNAHLVQFLSRLPDVALDYQPDAQEKQRRTRAAIVAAAHEEFCANGFDGASMDLIARRAAVAKPTLYHHFQGKEALFTEVLEAGRSHIITPLLGRQGDLVERLLNFANVYAEFVLRPDMLSLARLILGEAGRRPESAIAYHNAGPGLAFKGLVAFVEACQAKGELTDDPPSFVAQHLWSLILSGSRDHYLHHVDERPDAAEIRDAIRYGLTAFLRAYSTTPESDVSRLNERMTVISDQAPK